MEKANPEIQSLITDESFVRWVKNPDGKTNAYWENFLAQNPQHKPAVEEARKVVSAIRFADFEPTRQQVEQMYGSIQSRVQQSRTIAVPARGLAVTWRAWLAAASVTAVLVMAGWWLLYGSPTELATGFGEIRKVTLEDGTVVTLNGNTSLKVAKDLANQTRREVLVDGEAFFEVAKHPGSTFAVKTNRGLTIEVLGTVFNVNTRQAKASVLLTEGKVRLSAGAEQVVMRPGNVAVYNPEAQTLKVSKATTGAVSWPDGMIVLDNLTLREIVLYLKDTYGVTVSVTNKALLDKQLIGKMPIGNLDEFIQNLATTLDAQSQKKAGNQYELREAE